MKSVCAFCMRRHYCLIESEPYQSVDLAKATLSQKLLHLAHKELLLIADCIQDVREEPFRLCVVMPCW